MFLLEGMESVRAMRAPPSATEPERVYPVLAEIDLALILEAPGHGAGRLLGPGAEVEQLAYRGWIERLATRAEPEARRAKEVWSDLRAMRADLLNNQGVASANRSGGCTVLTWFRAGEPIRFAVRHVLDLFNQLGLLSLPCPPGGIQPGRPMDAADPLRSRSCHRRAANRVAAPGDRERSNRRTRSRAVPIRRLRGLRRRCVCGTVSGRSEGGAAR